MSLLDKIKSMFSGGSAHDHADHDHASHDHAGHDHSHEPVAPPVDPAGMPTSAPADEEDENRLG